MRRVLYLHHCHSNFYIHDLLSPRVPLSIRGILEDVEVYAEHERQTPAGRVWPVFFVAIYVFLHSVCNRVCRTALSPRVFRNVLNTRLAWTKAEEYTQASRGRGLSRSTDGRRRPLDAAVCTQLA